MDQTDQSSTADWPCKAKLLASQCGAAFSYAEPDCPAKYEGKPDTPACRCRPQCSPGEQYKRVQGGEVFHNTDTCVKCEMGYYSDASFPHFKEECKKCDAGKFTVSPGAVSENQCLPPQVIPYASSHRIFYFFGASLKSNTDCMQTWVGRRGMSDNGGVAAIRDSALSPMCCTTTTTTLAATTATHPGASCDYSVGEPAFIKQYTLRKLDTEFTWNHFPLDIGNAAGSDFLLVSALPGQAVDATFTRYQGDTESSELFDKPLYKETMCGCIDYTSILPSTCTGVFVLTYNRGGAAASNTKASQVDLWDKDASPEQGRTDALDQTLRGYLSRTGFDTDTDGLGNGPENFLSSTHPFHTYSCSSSSRPKEGEYVSVELVRDHPHKRRSRARAETCTRRGSTCAHEGAENPHHTNTTRARADIRRHHYHHCNEHHP